MGVRGEKLGMCIYACIGEVNSVYKCKGEVWSMCMYTCIGGVSGVDECGERYVHVCLGMSGMCVFRSRRYVLFGFIPIPSDVW